MEPTGVKKSHVFVHKVVNQFSPPPGPYRANQKHLILGFFRLDRFFVAHRNPSRFL